MREKVMFFDNNDNDNDVDDIVPTAAAAAATFYKFSFLLAICYTVYLKFTLSNETRMQ
jgi:hypothetical protein